MRTESLWYSGACQLEQFGKAKKIIICHKALQEFKIKCGMRGFVCLFCFVLFCCCCCFFLGGGCLFVCFVFVCFFGGEGVCLFLGKV